jgi:hypothetical protein
LSAVGLIDLQVAPNLQTDTLVLAFEPDRISLRTRRGEAMGTYARPITVGGLTVTVRRRPPVSWAAFAILSREAAIDRVLKDLAIAPRKATDIIDVSYTTADPTLAQRLSNEVVAVFRASQQRAVRVQAERSAEFLDGQRQRIAELQKTAQADLVSFQSRRRAGRRTERVDGGQADLATLDLRVAELDANRRVYGALLRRLQTGPESERATALRELAYSPEFTDDPENRKDRLLLRLWLSMPNCRALPVGQEVLWGNIEAGETRGGIGQRAAR